MGITIVFFIENLMLLNTEFLKEVYRLISSVRTV